MTHGSLEEHPVFSAHGALDIFFIQAISTLCRVDLQMRVKLGTVYNADQTAEKRNFNCSMFWLDRTNLYFFSLSETLDGNVYQFMLL